jgi:uncharacterized protein (DUF302 family)
LTPGASSLVAAFAAQSESRDAGRALEERSRPPGYLPTDGQGAHFMTEPINPDDAVDETSAESLPASDPPEWTGTHAGPPDGFPAVTQRADMKTVPTAFSVDEATARIESAVRSAGMKVFARIDQAAEARAAGLAMLPAVVLIFGSPKAGTALMVARPTAAIDLPLKALAWQDERGAVWLTYNTPALLVERHGLEPALAARLAPVGELLEKAVRE